MEKHILLLFADNLFGEDINLVKLDEQLQIAVQILINKGFKIWVSGDGNGSYEFAKKFVYIFQNGNICIIKYKLNYLQEENLIHKFNCVIGFEKEVACLAKSLYSAYVFINIDDNNKIQTECDEFTTKNLNAGRLVERIEEVNNYQFDKKNQNSINSEKISNDEFEEYKKQIKKTVEQFINNNNLIEAKNLITKYESIVKDDVDIYSMKGIIFIMEGNLEEAEKILNEGLIIYPISFDLLYNLGYLYEIQKKYKKEYLYYNKAFLLADEETKSQLENKISQLEDVEDVREYKVNKENCIATEILLIKMKKQICELKKDGIE